jgi:hypothetical protein
MNTHQAVLLSLIAALVLANLPFVRWRERVVARSPWLDAALWLIAYAAWMGLGALLAAGGAQHAGAGWEPWAVSFAWFAVLAFPGVVWRYLRQSGRAGQKNLKDAS